MRFASDINTLHLFTRVCIYVMFFSIAKEYFNQKRVVREPGSDLDKRCVWKNLIHAMRERKKEKKRSLQVQAKNALKYLIDAPEIIHWTLEAGLRFMFCNLFSLENFIYHVFFLCRKWASEEMITRKKRRSSTHVNCWNGKKLKIKEKWVVQVRSFMSEIDVFMMRFLTSLLLLMNDVRNVKFFIPLFFFLRLRLIKFNKLHRNLPQKNSKKFNFYIRCWECWRENHKWT